MTDDERYRHEKIESGTRFQDFVVDLLCRRRGLAIVLFSSREYQLRVGESLTGVEIKHDEKYHASGNLWIEVAEKAMPREGDFVPSGILRDDNTWLYVIGDYQTVYVFAKRSLVLLYESKRYPAIENNRKTSVGFLFPRSDAQRWAAFVERVRATEPAEEAPPPAENMNDPGAMVAASEIKW